MEQLNDTAILSTAYFPNIQYVSKLLFHKKTLIDTNETYLKQSFRNRFEIASANGKLNLTIPILKPEGNRTKTKDIRIDYTTPWQKNHWRAIVSAYSNSPFFEIFEKELTPLFETKESLLINFNQTTIEQLFKCLGISVDISFCDNYIPKDKYKYDFRDSISPKKRLQEPDPDFIPNPYYQVFQNKLGFIHNLSFLDLLMNEGPNALYIVQKSIPIT